MLSQRFVERHSKPGRYRDSVIAGLLLQISQNGAKSFVLRYQLNHAEHMLGLGSASAFTLKEARSRARAARQLLADGLDPLAAKRADQSAAKAAAAKRLTFREAAEKYFDQHQGEWRSVSHRDQFLTTLRTHVFPTLGDMDVAVIATDDVLRALEHKNFWTEKTITADRTRGRIEAVLDWATVRGHRPPGTNAARWKGHLDQVLPSPRKTKPIVHHAAMDYREVPAFMVALRADKSVTARALEFLILTAGRTGEVRLATWDEINFAEATWTIPAEKMKNKREHCVTLSPAAVDLLGALPRERGNPHIFIGPLAGRGLSRMAMTYVMQRVERDDVTIHGFRSSFSDWAHESTAHSNHTIEISLAHNVGSEVERAYRRGPMMAKRVKLMADWAKYCAAPEKVATKGDRKVVAIVGGRR
jgi:integrase